MTVRTDADLIAEATSRFLRLRETGDVGQRSELRRWLATDVRHAAAMDVVERGWSSAAALAPAAAAPFPPPRPRGFRSRAPGRRTSPQGLAWVAGLAASVLLLVGAEYRGIGVGWPRSFTTLGDAQTIVLADGSQLRMQPHSQATVRESLLSRKVVLGMGQGAFTVAHERARPFIVQAGTIGVEATGTRFAVRTGTAGTHVELWQGGVRLRDRKSGAVLTEMRPGDRAAVGSSGRITLTHPALTPRVFVFADTPLADAITRIALNSGLQTRFRRSELARLPINSVYHGTDLRAFLNDLQAVEPICWRQRGKTIEIYDKAATCGEKSSLR